MERIPTRYYEDIEVGDVFVSGTRTISEEEVDTFCRLSGDWHPIHSDADFAAASRFGRRLVHGPMGIAIAVGLFSSLQEFSESAVVMIDIKSWLFKTPIFIGDTVHTEMRIASKHLSSKGDVGVVDRHIRLFREGSILAQEGFMGMLIKRSPRAAA